MTLKGIDVSHWQHPLGVDYSLLYNEGVRFAFIRSAYGTLDDNAFFGHVARALANKIAVGAYSFMHARHDITTQAKKCAQLYEYMPLGCVLDVEQDVRQQRGEDFRNLRVPTNVQHALTVVHEVQCIVAEF